MDFYSNAPLYRDLGLNMDTCELADPTDHERVINATVVEIASEGATYRGACFQGIFLLADQKLEKLPADSNDGVRIYCRWFGGQFGDDIPRFMIDPAKARLIKNYTGYVFTNFKE